MRDASEAGDVDGRGHQHLTLEECDSAIAMKSMQAFF